MALTKVTGFGIGTIVDNVVMTSDDPTITMTDSSGTNDIATLQATSGALIFTARDGSADGEIIFKKTDGSATDETMRINSAGKCLLGPYGAFGGANTKVLDLSATGNAALGVGRNDDDLGACLRFFKIDTSNNTGTIVGSISLASSSTTYATSSDYRLKTSVSYDWDATTKLKQLKPARFKWIADGGGAEFVDGFLAHEAATVVPEAVIGDKDAVDADGNIDPQGMDYSKVVPLLVKTIQELEARIVALETA